MSTNATPRKPRGINASPLTDKAKIKMVYRRMVQSCTDTNHPSYPSYGGRGIYVNRNDWANPQAFYEWALTSGYAPGLSIDRLDNAGPYAIANVRWTDRKTQQRNMTNNRRFDYFGVELTVGEILELHQGNYSRADTQRLSARLQAGWEMQRALTAPRSVNGRKPGYVGKLAHYHYQGNYYTAKQLLLRVHSVATKNDVSRFLSRVTRSWSLEEALLLPSTK